MCHKIEKLKTYHNKLIASANNILKDIQDARDKFEEVSTRSIKMIHRSLNSNTLAWNYAMDSQKLIDHVQLIANNALEKAINEVHAQQYNNASRYVRKKKMRRRINYNIEKQINKT